MTRPPTHRARAINTHTGLDITTPTGRNSATWEPCPQCRARTLTGLDDSTAGIPVRVDPTTLTRSDEAAALLAGRTTYTLHRQPDGRPQLRHRDHWTITGHPADTVTVVPAHHCHQPLGTPLPTTRRTKEPADDRPPF